MSLHQLLPLRVGSQIRTVDGCMMWVISHHEILGRLMINMLSRPRTRDEYDLYRSEITEQIDILIWYWMCIVRIVNSLSIASTLYQTTRRHVPEESRIHSNRLANSTATS
jgi:hypothetical protein